MKRFNKIEKSCEEALIKYAAYDKYAFESGYYKSQLKYACIEIDEAQQEIESLKAEIQELKKELA